MNPLKAILKEVIRKEKIVLIFDFDGTLADLNSDPQAVTLPAQTLKDLVWLSKKSPHKVLILSGRDLKFLKTIFDESIQLIGEHGAATSEENIFLIPEVAHSFFKQKCELHPGSFTEQKQTSLSWHYRQTSQPLKDNILASYQRELNKSLASFDYKCEIFDFVLEVLPQSISKKKFLSNYLKDLVKDKYFALCFGDDIGEEDFFPVVEDYGGVSFSVGHKISGGMQRFSNPAELRAWLSELVELLKAKSHRPLS